MSATPNPADYDPEQSFDSVSDCIALIATYPQENQLDLLLATVRANIEADEYGFASEIVSEFQTIEPLDLDPLP
jgi:hypothetical protein